MIKKLTSGTIWVCQIIIAKWHGGITIHLVKVVYASFLHPLFASWPLARGGRISRYVMGNNSWMLTACFICMHVLTQFPSLEKSQKKKAQLTICPVWEDRIQVCMPYHNMKQPYSQSPWGHYLHNTVSICPGTNWPKHSYRLWQKWGWLGSVLRLQAWNSGHRLQQRKGGYNVPVWYKIMREMNLGVC